MALFSAEKKDGEEPKKEERPVSGRTTGAGVAHTLLDRGSEFDGKLTFEGQVIINGKYTGHITTKDVLVIGESARVSAEINAGTVIINGNVEGTIRATTIVELHPPARVKGTIEAPAMSMEKGVIFDGVTKMDASSKGNAPPPPAPPK
jgi:cytoskeletal protein CcmA (bactofilin family)